MKKLAHIVSVLVLALLLASCATSVRVSYMKPSLVDMGGYKNIAIASTVPYKGYRINYPYYVRPFDHSGSSLSIRSSYTRALPRDVAEYATSRLYKTLSGTNFFEGILSPSQTDSILSLPSSYDTSAEFKRLGYDAVLIPKVENMGIDEYVFSKRHKKSVNGKSVETTTYYIHRIASISYSITVIDTTTSQIVAKRYYEDSYEWESSFNPKTPIFAVDADDMFERMIRGFSEKILRDFVPAKVSQNVELMSNSGKVESLKSAYKDVDKGNIVAALTSFENYWNSNSYIPAGYNAALLYAVLGKYDTAIELAKEVYNTTGSSDANQLYSSLVNWQKSTESALSQINGSSASSESYSGTTLSVYEYVMGN